MRCAYCHEQLSSAIARVCEDCGTRVHPQCAEDLFECPTLGCENTGFGLATDLGLKPQSQPGALRAASWVFFGVLAPALAFYFDTWWSVNPLGWGRSFVWPEPGGVIPFAPRLLTVWLAVFGSILGMLLFLLGRYRLSLPLLALGVLCALTHSIVFAPLVPLSLSATLLMGIGLLGLSPYLALAVYLDAFGRAQGELASAEKTSRGFLVDRSWKWARVGSLFCMCGAALGLHWVSPTATYPTPGAVHLAGVDPAELRAEAMELTQNERTHGTWGEAVHGGWAEGTNVSESLAYVSSGAIVHVEPDYLRFDWDEEWRVAREFPYGYSLYVLTGDRQEPPAFGTCYRSVEIAPGIWSQYFVKGEPLGGGPVFQPLVRRGKIR